MLMRWPGQELGPGHYSVATSQAHVRIAGLINNEITK
jgi:hypothetical protein